jgi:hypothetical protein
LDGNRRGTAFCLTDLESMRYVVPDKERASPGVRY